MRGTIAISEDLPKNNRMNWNIFDFFKLELKLFTESNYAGWYAYKLIDKIYYFKWCDDSGEQNKKYLMSLKRNGWKISNQYV